MELISFSENKIHEKKLALLWVPHFDGGVSRYQKKAEYFENLGYESYFLKLSSNVWPDLLESKEFYFKKSVRHIWEKEILETLEKIKKPTILVTHSFPAGMGLIAASKNKQIKGISCEGGPFVSYFTCAWNLFTHAYSVNALHKKIWILFISYLVFRAFSYKRQLREALRNLSQNFPVLLLFNENDKLVKRKHMEEVFSHQNHLKITSTLLKGTEHVRGWKGNQRDYTKSLSEFIDSVEKSL